MYLTAVSDSFGAGIDYAMLIKIYGKDLEGNTRYSPAQCLGSIPQSVTGDPDVKHVSTSYVERQNLKGEWLCVVLRASPTRSTRNWRTTLT
jgi:hypothetical protein